MIGLQDLDQLTVDPPNSSAAMCAASIDPCPVAVANTQFISVSTPIRMASPLISACAVDVSYKTTSNKERRTSISRL
jgi:hypothetical protein